MTPRRWLAILFAAALALRVWAVVMWMPPSDYQPRADAREYNLLAKSLVEGLGFAWPPGGSRHGFYPLPEGPTSSRAPLYPAFLSIIYRLVGIGHYTAARLVQCVVGAILCLILYQIGMIWGSSRIAWLSAVTAAVYPPFLRFSYFAGPAHLLSEGLFMTLFALAVWQILRLTRDIRNRRAAVLAGLALGLSMMTRPIPTLFPGVLLVWAWLAPRPERREWLRAVGVVTLVFAAVLLPWTVRNALVHHRPVLVSTDQGHSLWLGNNELARGGGVPLDDLFKPEEFDPGFKMSEWERYNKMSQQGFAFWREHPEQLPKLFLRKVLMLWNPYELRYNLWYGLLVLPWALLGLIVTWRGPNAQVNRLLLGILCYASFVTVITVGTTRCRYPFEPYLILLAAAGLGWWSRRPMPRWASAGVLAGVVAVHAAIYRHSDTFLQLFRDGFQLLGLR